MTTVDPCYPVLMLFCTLLLTVAQSIKIVRLAKDKYIAELSWALVCLIGSLDSFSSHGMIQVA